MSDFVVMRKGATMAIASARVTSMAINKPIDPEDLGGWRIHADKSGLVDVVVDTDQQALDAIRRFLSYLPSHNMEPPPVAPVPEGSEEGAKKILEILPESRAKVYDVRKIIGAIADLGSQFEIKARFGRSITTSLARLRGQSVGFIASNPLYKGGALDVDACNKVTSFMVLCDSFNIPIVFLVDVPGFLIGVEGEIRGAPGRVINWMNAMSLVTMPKITIIMRKSYGQAYINMGGGRNSDEFVCWPTADLGFRDPAVGANVLLGEGTGADAERRQQVADDISQDTSAWGLAELFEAQAVIDPRDTRDYLIRALEVHRLRLNKGVGQHLLRNWPTSY
jgi:acetyl-CoA carboxylase carboxyltransferase component